MPSVSSEQWEAALRRTLDDLRTRAGSEPILDSLINTLVTEAQRRGESQRAARTLQSVADELLASVRPGVRRGFQGDHGYRPRTRPAP